VGALDRQPTLRNALQVQRLLQAGYPPLLRDAGVTGEVQVAFVVTEEGETRDVRVVSASNEAFGEPAVAAVRAMRFTPGELAGKATAARVQIPVSFTPVRTEPAAPPQET
jgi:protein TonB